MAEVIELNSRRTLSMVRTRIEKRTENGNETEKDVTMMLSIVHRYLRCVDNAEIDAKHRRLAADGDVSRNDQI